jgi:hypothetical protein
VSEREERRARGVRELLLLLLARALPVMSRVGYYDYDATTREKDATITIAELLLLLVARALPVMSRVGYYYYDAREGCEKSGGCAARVYLRAGACCCVLKCVFPCNILLSRRVLPGNTRLGLPNETICITRWIYIFIYY